MRERAFFSPAACAGPLSALSAFERERGKLWMFERGRELSPLFGRRPRVVVVGPPRPRTLPNDPSPMRSMTW